MSEFICGAISGIGQVIVGYPFDTIKVRMQNNATNKNMKLKHYFNGMKYPIISSSIINSIVFSTYYNSIETTNNKFISGSLGGLFCSPVVFVFDIFKTRSQMKLQTSYKHIVQTKGIGTTTIREMLAFGIYFSTYETLRDMGYGSLFSGGIAGLTNWGLTYPLDVIRNRQIVTNETFMSALKKGNIMKGYGICMTRALIVNSVGFYIYEECKKLIGK